MIDEKSLITQAQNGNINAFRQIVEEHKKMVYYLSYDLTGNREDAKDLSQDVFIKVFQSFQSFRSAAKFSSWLYRITVNEFISLKRKKNYLIRKNQLPILEKDMETNFTADQVNMDQEVESSLLQIRIRKALNRLTRKERAVFILRHYHDLKLDDIGKSLKLSTGTVKSLLFRTVKKLQKQLTPYYQE
jgi:RNA polymerase sigma-70 factor (ECF subfamily)